MKKLKTSTWVLIGLIVVTGALATTMVVLKPDDFSHFGYGKRHMLSEEEWESFRENWEQKRGELEPERFKELKESRRFGFGRSHHGGRFGGYWGGHDGGHWGGALIIGLLLIGGTTLVIFAVKRRSSGRTDSSLSILEEQYAEGKLSEEEFRRKRNVLRENGRED